MRMRWKPCRGERFKTLDGLDVLALEIMSEGKSDMVKCVMPDGSLGVISKGALNLPIIDTKNYEKII